MSSTPAVPAVPDTGSDLPAVPEDTYGLEDFESTDFVMPRINILHKEAMLVDNLTGNKTNEMVVILLGLVKQRILWDAEDVDDAKPLCKSYDFQNGNPDFNKFPWAPSGFDKSAVSEGDQLPCAGCQLKEWGSHPKRESPWCSEQWSFPLMQPIEGGGYAPALFTVQRSAIKPARSYASGFARQKKPMFQVLTKVTLTPAKRGSNEYAVPTFSQVSESDQDQWAFFGENYLTMREFLQRPPAKRDEQATAETATAPPAPTPDDDDVPF